MLLSCRVVFCLLLGGVAAATHAAEQAYPSKPVRLIVPFAAGSGTDTIARVVMAGMAQSLGQQVIVENRAGAAGSIGAEIASKAPADGYTMLFSSQTHAVNAALGRKLAYDLQRDFAPVMQVATGPQVFVIHPSLPVKTVPDLVKLAKARPGAINFGSGGAGTAAFLGVELFRVRAGIDLVHVPYRGGSEAMTATMAGEVSLFATPSATAIANIRQGRVRALAVTSPKRLASLPEVPTVAESGYPGYESGNWYGLMLPAKTPKEPAAAIYDAARAAVGMPDVVKRVDDLGFLVVGSKPDEFGAFIKAEIERLGPILRTLPAGSVGS